MATYAAALRRVSLPRRAVMLAVAGPVALAAGYLFSADQSVMLLALVGAVPILMLFLIDDELLVMVGALAVLLGSLAVAQGAPEAVRLMHFGPATVAFLRLLMPRERSTAQQAFAARAMALILVILVSAAVNGWIALRPVLLALLLLEPFIFLALVTRLSASSVARVRAVIVALALVQLVLVGWQLHIYGSGDLVTGTFASNAGGSHIVGAAGVVGAIMMVRGARAGGFPAASLAAAGLLLMIGFASEAKQILAAIVLAMAALTLVGQVRPRFMIAGGLLFLAVLLVGERIVPRATSTVIDAGPAFAEQKLSGTASIVQELGWTGAVLGVGPGSGLSRVSLSALPQYGLSSPILLGSETSDLARRQGEQRGNTSTLIATPLATSLSLYTDIGLLGVAAYGALALWAWRLLDEASPSDRQLGLLLLAFAGILGLMSNWLEVPEVTVYLAIAVGVLLVPIEGGRRGNATGEGQAAGRAVEQGAGAGQ